MEAVEKIIAYLSPEYHQACDLRNEELRIPLGIRQTRKDIEQDKNAIHLGLFEGGLIVACACLWPIGHNGKPYQIRQVAVKNTHKNRGLGRRIMKFTENEAKKIGAIEVYVHARLPVAEFYNKLGYQQEGNTFYEVGIPHILMTHQL